jgi:putative colanic acid biosynthesis UDP-glucose lipid carrier transferase
MPIYQNHEGRSVLRRRSNISNPIQAALDGLAVIGISYLLIINNIGLLTWHYLIMVLVLMGLMAIVYDQFGVYRAYASFSHKIFKIAKAWTIAFALLLFLGFVTKQTDYFSRLLLGELYALGLIAQILLHFFVRIGVLKFVQRAGHHENALIIGQGQLADYLYRKISDNPWLAQSVVGSISINDVEYVSAENSISPQLLGRLEDLEDILVQCDVNTVYIVTNLHESKRVEEIYSLLLDKHVIIHWIPDIFSLRLVNHNVKEIAGLPLLTLAETPLIGTRYLLKAVEDKVLAILSLFFLSPVFLSIAFLIKLDSRGPVFFRQERSGWSGKPFYIWKFRSMVVHQAKGGIIKQAEKNDPRVTRIGRFLRKTSIDELPQLFNVISGDMSLVGPRPHAVQHDEEYSRRISDYFARHNIKPGMTGLAQVRGYRGETKDIGQMMHRVESDIEYINNWSVWLDLLIIVRTFKVIAGKNAY